MTHRIALIAVIAALAAPFAASATTIRVHCDGTVRECAHAQTIMRRAEHATPALPTLPPDGWGGMIINAAGGLSCAVAYTNTQIGYACGVFQVKRPGDLLWRVRWTEPLGGRVV